MNISFCFMFLLIFLENDETTGIALKCYECEYWGERGGHEGCQHNPPPNKYLKNCNSGQCSVGYAVDKDHTYVTRTCTAGNKENGCHENLLKDNHHDSPYRAGTRCVCDDKDGCNAGGTVSSEGFYLGLLGLVLAGRLLNL